MEDPTAPCPVSFSESVTAFAAEAERVAAVLDGAPGGWGERSTRLPAWNLRQLAAHVVRAVTRVPAALEQPPPSEVRTGWLEYWRAASRLDPADIAQRSIEQAGVRREDELVEALRAGTAATLADCESEAGDRPVPTILGGMRLDHYLTTRVLELAIHSMDVDHALGLTQRPTPAGAAVACAVTEGLLGAPRPGDLDDDVAWLLAATGRAPHDDPRLPVLR